ncbi:protein-export chaperone SecB [Massilia scottii]|uniref:protein-export chaperone SecB n=1 Tax=Massilia scottii TaxID=3057166 RepID=UPI002796AF1E|nr:protein-export chaperone SecB [Massilia sp. CCM 9029]MDQ1834679.1 protein-export chaperone SecB [Massilia sp. CCM 9029]
MLRLSPKKFHVTGLAMGPVEELDLQLGERQSGLSVEALVGGPSTVVIMIFLRLIIEDGIGIRVNYAGDFDIVDPDVPNFAVTEQILSNTFIQVNAPAIAYPFLRAYISTLTVNSGFEQVLLPPVNFQAIFDKRKKNEGEVTSKIEVR